MNNEINNNQHYITESFIKNRFGTNGFVQRYDVIWDSWKIASPQFVFSGRGYTQMLTEGEPVDNSLEESFGKIENQLKFVFPALDESAQRKSTTVSKEIYDNLCLYCSYLWHLSPFAKAKAPANYVIELDMDLKRGNVRKLRELGILENDITTIQRLHAEGKKFIFNEGNYLQWAFRVQFIHNAINKAAFFRNIAKWTVYNSPIELPISDIALVDYPESNKATLFILPTSPHLVLIGRIEHGTPPPFYTNDTIIYGDTLTTEAAEHVFDLICFSGIKAVACQNKLDIKASRERATKKKIAFTKISNLDAVLAAGEQTFKPNMLRLLPVSKEEYTKFIHTFVMPPNLQPIISNQQHIQR